MIEPLLSARELGELLGYSAATIVNWAEAGKVPAFKIGGRLRFRASEVEVWLDGQRLDGPGAGGEVSATPTARRPTGVLSHVSATPLRGGEDA
jgi:excisionase family DNA binding protein